MGLWSPLVVSMEMPATLTVLSTQKTLNPLGKWEVFSHHFVSLSLSLRNLDLRPIIQI